MPHGLCQWFLHAHTLKSTQTQRHTPADPSTGGIAWILHRPMTWMQFREMEKDVVLTMYPWDRGNSIWYQSRVGIKLNCALWGKGWQWEGKVNNVNTEIFLTCFWSRGQTQSAESIDSSIKFQIGFLVISGSKFLREYYHVFQRWPYYHMDQWMLWCKPRLTHVEKVLFTIPLSSIPCVLV